jgi:pyrimidine-nucleoside phosphorylase
VTGTVGNVSLIAASIMSKKLAGGADAIVLDVKMGRGSFMPTLERARELAELMVEIGKNADRKTVALLADMNQPLGHAVGNALEVKEAIATLNGEGPDDFWAHCRDVAGHMLLLAGKADTLEGAIQLASKARTNGQALEKFRQMVEAQGGDGEMILDPTRLPKAEYVEPVYAKHGGTIAGIDAQKIGWSCVRQGAGRQVKGETIDHAAGMVIPHKIGDYVAVGDLLGTVHAGDPVRLALGKEELKAAFSWSKEPVESLPHFYGVVS